MEQESQAPRPLSGGLVLQSGGAKRSQRANQARGKANRAPAKTKKSASATPPLSILQGGSEQGEVFNAAELISSWTPGQGFEEVTKVWDQIAPTVRKTLLQLSFTDPKLTRAYLAALSRHTASRFSLGNRIDDPIELFNDQALATSFDPAKKSNVARATRNKELTYLRKIRTQLLPDLYGKRSVLEYGRRRSPSKYSPKEIAELFAYARQRSQKSSKNFLALLLLSFGAGLSTSELSGARGSDLISTPWGLLIETTGVQVGGTPFSRLTPILALYEDELSELAKEFEDKLFIGAWKNSSPRQPNTLAPRKLGIPVFSSQEREQTG